MSVFVPDETARFQRYDLSQGGSGSGISHLASTLYKLYWQCDGKIVEGLSQDGEPKNIGEKGEWCFIDENYYISVTDHAPGPGGGSIPKWGAPTSEVRE